MATTTTVCVLNHDDAHVCGNLDRGAPLPRYIWGTSFFFVNILYLLFDIIISICLVIYVYLGTEGRNTVSV